MAIIPQIPSYKIEKRIGKGGMGTVYLAFQEKLERQVALKVLLPIYADDNKITQRFMTEAKIAAKLQHTNIVSIYDVGEYQDNYYFAMEYLPRSLMDIIKFSENGQIKPEVALNILKQISSALDYAHKKGVIHRDVKPSNIMLRSDGTPVLVDFGIAKLMESTSNLTKTGTSIGTPHYMSPEQIQGLDTDGRADIYSLGVVFYEMLEGKVPYEGTDSISIAVKHVREPIPRLSEKAKDLQLIIDQTMAKDKRERIQTGKDLMKLIADIQKKKSIKTSGKTLIREPYKTERIAEPEAEPVKKPPIQKSFRKLRLGIFAVIGAVVLVSVLIISNSATEKKQAQKSSKEQNLWETVIRENSLLSYNRYLEKYPNGRYSQTAREKIVQIKQSQKNKEETDSDQKKNQELENLYQDYLTQARTAVDKRDFDQARDYIEMARNIREGEELTHLEQKINKLKIQVSAPYRLRKFYMTLNDSEAVSMLKKKGFYDSRRTKYKKFRNSFVQQIHNGKKVIVDQTTGLMWHPAGSARLMDFNRSIGWISSLNRNRFAGFSDWRLPTLEEAASLLVNRKTSRGLFVDPIFSSKQRQMWTGDHYDHTQVWMVYFNEGCVDINLKQFESFVRPVRSIY